MILPEEIVNSAKELEDKLEDIKNEIKRFLPNDQHPGFTVVPEIGGTKFAVQFTVKKGTNEIKVDLLPTFNFTGKDDLYKQMKDGPENLLPYYKACLAKLQVAFVSPIPANVKNLIRLIKYWSKKYVSYVGSTRSRPPNSYVLELITIHLWESKGRPNHFNTLKALHSVMETLANNQSIRAIWRGNYAERMIPENTRYQRPLVMDPANPFNNVCLAHSWDGMKEKAEKALKSPMLCNVTSTTWL